MNIDRGVPIPPSHSGRKRPESAEARVILAMQIGDSVLFRTDAEAHRFAASLHQLGKKRGFRSLFRKTADGWRVWKIALDGASA